MDYGQPHYTQLSNNQWVWPVTYAGNPDPNLRSKLGLAKTAGKSLVHKNSILTFFQNFPVIN